MKMFKGNMVQRYSLRKYSVGLCSALLGLFLIGSPSIVTG
ncbi:YSIRK-type signal peptide-containing protein [Streptococcus sp. 121]|nr:YSIRK-type signal peptide-containing protein [Streptococcus sp. 121]